MIAVYCRVSSKSQKTDSQIPDIKRWLSGHGIKKENVLWFEDSETGRTLKRAQFQALQKSIFAGDIDTVVVWKLDRISRKLIDGLLITAEWCDRGVRVVSVTQQIDLNGPTGRMLASVMFGLAEIENEDRAERQAAGIALAKQKGVYRGRKLGSSKANPVKAHKLAQLGLTQKDIGSTLGVSERTVQRYLRKKD